MLATSLRHFSHFKLGVLTLSLAFPFASAFGQVIMMDFGGTTVTGSDQTNSPYHSANGAFTDTSWNKQGQGNDATLNWSDGTVATGVALTTFKNNSSGQTNVVAAGWSASVSGTQVNTGIYAGTSVGADGYMMSSTLTDARAIGVQLSGLSFGTYDIYVAGRNTNYIAAEYTLNYYASAAASSGAFDFATYDTESLTFAASATDDVSEWAFDSSDPTASNYVKFTVTLTAENPYLNLATMGNPGGSMAQGIFSAIQIVTVPEPSAPLLLGGVGLLAFALRRHRSAI